MQEDLWEAIKVLILHNLLYKINRKIHLIQDKIKVDFQETRIFKANLINSNYKTFKIQIKIKKISNPKEIITNKNLIKRIIISRTKDSSKESRSKNNLETRIKVNRTISKVSIRQQATNQIK
jgi:hypothetical protein